MPIGVIVDYTNQTLTNFVQKCIDEYVFNKFYTQINRLSFHWTDFCSILNMNKSSNPHSNYFTTLNIYLFLQKKS